jgi:hypothetical protein
MRSADDPAPEAVRPLAHPVISKSRHFGQLAQLTGLQPHISESVRRDYFNDPEFIARGKSTLGVTLIVDAVPR